jgi:hypothetical protein
VTLPELWTRRWSGAGIAEASSWWDDMFHILEYWLSTGVFLFIMTAGITIFIVSQAVLKLRLKPVQ